MARKAGALTLLALCTATGLLSLGEAAATPRDGCPAVDVPAAELRLAEFDASVFCLVNRRRAVRGLRMLTSNPLLRRAAADYSDSLLLGRFFSHNGDFAGHPNTSTVIGRLRQIGYVRPGYRWVVGEDLRWSAPATSSPGAILQAWMTSPIHRMYLLKPRFTELGVASSRGIPVDPSEFDGVTVAAEFGFRRS
jgi:uncharacterized protein YkwD